MIVFAGGAIVERIAGAAAQAYPEECCGLLIGHRVGGDLHITHVAASPNVAPAERTRRFEVDPALRLSLMRRLRGSDEEIVGHYHSHPNGLVQPSEHDAAMAFEPDLVWIVVAVERGVAGTPGAFLYDAEAGRFRSLPLVVGA